MAIDLDALKRELNVCMRREPDEHFYSFPEGNAAHCLRYAFGDSGLPRECLNVEKIIGEAIRLLEEEMRKDTEILEILKKHAGSEADHDD